MTNPGLEASSRRRGHVYAVLALVTCPCHLPILALLLSFLLKPPLLSINTAVLKFSVELSLSKWHYHDGLFEYTHNRAILS